MQKTKNRLTGMFFLFILMPILFGYGTALAQPTDAQIIKDISGPGTISITLTKKNGHKQWNSDYGVWEYVRGVKEALREYPQKKGVTLKVVGDAVYQLYGSQYKYWKFRVISNEYLGMGTPSSKELMRLLRSDMEKFVSNYWYNLIVGDIKALYFPDDPHFIWHTTNSVSFNVIAEYRALVNNTDTEYIVQTFEVRLYRDGEDKPWKNFLSIARKREKSNRQTHTRSEIARMKTLADLDREQRANEAAKNLPRIEVKTYKNGKKLALALHTLLHDGTPDEVEAFLLKTLTPNYFVNGKRPALTQQGADLINEAVEWAFKKEGTYKQQYCRKPKISKRSGKKRIHLLGCINNVKTTIGVQKSRGGYVEGVKQPGSWQITMLSVGVRTDPDAIEYIHSFSNRKKLCPKD